MNLFNKNIQPTESIEMFLARGGEIKKIRTKIPKKYKRFLKKQKAQ